MASKPNILLWYRNPLQGKWKPVKKYVPEINPNSNQSPSQDLIWDIFAKYEPKPIKGNSWVYDSYKILRDE